MMRRLPRLNLANLWDSSSSSSDDDDIEILDDHPTVSIATTTNNRSDQPSLPLTNSFNMGRLSLLPAFPSLHQHGVVAYRNRDHLLLASVPRHQLTSEQRRERAQNTFSPSFTLTDHRKENNQIPSLFLTMYQQLYGDLTRRLHVNDVILDYNYPRLFKCMDLMTSERIQRRFQTTHAGHYEQLPLSEYAIALEFYLQIDVNLFYMKTCSFRGARANLSHHQGLFCLNEPEIRYGMAQCHQQTCPFCFPSQQITAVRHLQQQNYEPVVRFSSAQKHRFVSGYEAILNCPTSCATNNIIYALTCPCGQFDYIGYTSMTLNQRLFYHRKHGNRIMREFLLGSQNIRRLDPKTKCQEDLVKDGMLLYRHSARCSVAMQWFLDCNPQYWPFVPIKKERARIDNQVYIVPSSIPTDPTSPLVTQPNLRSDSEAGTCLTDLPPFPSDDDYTFSTRQCAEQFEIFKDKRNQLLPNTDLDLYNATIIAVLPHDCSGPLQRLVEALLITHAETKLNTMGHLDGSVTNNYDNSNRHGMTHERIIADRGRWCHNLIRRSISSICI